MPCGAAMMSKKYSAPPHIADDYFFVSPGVDQYNTRRPYNY
jgi:hypothetical protein